MLIENYFLTRGNFLYFRSGKSIKASRRVSLRALKVSFVYRVISPPPNSRNPPDHSLNFLRTTFKSTNLSLNCARNDNTKANRRITKSLFDIWYLKFRISPMKSGVWEGMQVGCLGVRRSSKSNNLT